MFFLCKQILHDIFMQFPPNCLYFEHKPPINPNVAQAFNGVNILNFVTKEITDGSNLNQYMGHPIHFLINTLAACALFTVCHEIFLQRCHEFLSANQPVKSVILV